MGGKGKRTLQGERESEERGRRMYVRSVMQESSFSLLGSHELVVRRFPRMTTARKVVAFRVKNLCF